MAYPLGKWTKYKFLVESGKLAEALPRTQKMNEQSFWFLLDELKSIIVKPSTGYGGDGVIQISALGEDQYMVHYGPQSRVFRGRKTVYQFIREQTKGATHIVQQWIPLAKIDSRPFDIRVMVQRTPKSDWAITGTLAKIAGEGYFITNVARSKGKVVPVSTAIHSSNIHIRRKTEQKIQEQIQNLSLETAKQLQKYYPSIHTVGLDVGVDQKGKVWIIEANFTPNKELFLRLKDKSIYKVILSCTPKQNKK